MCNCNNTTTTLCQEPVDCTCKVFLKSECVNNFTSNLECSNIMKGQTLDETIVQLDAYICTKFDSITNFFELVNLGSGSQVYKGVSMLGKKEFRTLVDSGLINLVQGANDITISVDEEALAEFIADTNTTYSAGTGMSLVGTTFNNTAPDQTVVLTEGGATTITGTYPNFTIASTDTNTTYSAGTGITLTGTTFSLANLQKEITANYTLTNADNEYTIFINNTAPITITLNTTVTTPNFCVGFIQEGADDVTFVGTGVTLTNPIGLLSKGEGYQTFIERKLATSTFYLLGNTKA